MPEIGPDEFVIPFFQDRGFTRKKCPTCQSNYWSSNPDQTNCGEVPCEQYSFIGRPPTKVHYSIPEMRNQFLNYFAENGHTKIKPYPIVARWRDDVYLVGASIYDFQPYVTEGTMPPPANPLVISQPSIRFTDIDSVGLTHGRYGTVFEMGGAHAFNYPNKEIYWKDQTVRYHHQLLTEVMGVPSESVTYKEHFWSGGGNAGPDLEAIASGLEISTLVFMQYKVQNDQLIQLPIRTVDTGYGIERWAWLSTGSPSGFHAIYGSLLEDVMKLARLDVDQRIIESLTRNAGKYHSTIRESRKAFLQSVSNETGKDIEKIAETAERLEAIYAITDHSKAVTFLLAEGVVPSNVGEGYLARLIIRRAARLARQLDIFDQLPTLVEGQIKLWGGDFHLLREMRADILEGLHIEMEKYNETLSRGSEVVQRLSKELADTGVSQIPLEQLIQLYDSHGLAPEIVKEEAEKLGVRAEIPDNFLTLVAESHNRPTHEGEGDTLPRSELDEKLKDLPPTSAIYYDDPYQTRFKAKVVAILRPDALVLDQTAFYPQGGGQPADRGELRFASGKAKVIDVQKVGSTIIHFLDESIGPRVDYVEGEIDWGRRQNLMRHHTGTHVLLGAARRVLGEHVWQAGAQKDVENSRLDITHYQELTQRERERIEEFANQVIMRDLPVQISWMARGKAESKYGYRLYQGGAVPGAKIRVVRITGWDAEACGGTHVKRTGELGLFKIEKTGRLQDGVERIIFSAGQPALKRVNQSYETLAKASALLNTTPDQLPKSVKSLLAERDKLEKQVKRAQSKTVENKLLQIQKSAVEIGPVKLVLAKIARTQGVDPVQIANRLKETDPTMVAVIFEISDSVQVVAAAGEKAVESGIDCGQIVSLAARRLHGGGGGRPFFATGGGPVKDNATEAMKVVEQTIENQLASTRTVNVA
ncbi:MAG TPA: alanine--tRNA ligase [Candidatus Bathyarchaeia archaeon]|nr:alanine--tRNA ligase [Candidatus Bathyarchaeia archaeon]